MMVNQDRIIRKYAPTDRDKRYATTGAIAGSGVAAGAALPLNTTHPDNSRLNIESVTPDKHGIRDVPVSEVRGAATFRGRRFGNDIHTAQLAQNIRNTKYDRSQPVNVVRYKNGSYALRGGHHRLEAMEMLGRDTVPVKVEHSAEDAPKSRVPLIMQDKFMRMIGRERGPKKKMSDSEIDALANKKISPVAQKINSLNSRFDDFNRMHPNKAKVVTLGVPAAAAAAGGSLIYRHQKKKSPVTKRDDKEPLKAGAATAGGAALGTATYLGGYGGKYYLKAQRKKHPLTEAQKKTWNEFNAKHPKPDAQFFRNYPKGLPGSQLQRLLGYTHAGKTGLALNAGMAAAGGTGGYLAYDKLKKEKVKKNDGLQSARDGLQQKLNSMPANPTEGSNVHQRKVKIQQQIDALDQKIKSGADVTAENAANKARGVTPPKPVSQLNLAMRSLRGMTHKGFYVPAAAITGAGVTGYEIKRRSLRGNH